MNISLFNGFLLLGIVVTTVLDVLVLGSSEAAKIINQYPLPNRCSYSRAKSVLKARCSNLELKKIPLDLNADIQVLDLTRNQLTELKNDSLHCYKKLAFIYLDDNSICEIDEAAFANQPYLDVLDLSNNELTVIPNIGVQPTLHNLYVPNNKITSISTEDLAPFCSLKEIDLTRNRIRFNAGSCDCQRFNAWVKLRQIKVKPDEFYNCTNSPTAFNKDCANVEFSNLTYELFDECSAIRRVQHEIENVKIQLFWIYFVLCMVTLFFVLYVVLYCMHKQTNQLTATNDNIEMH